MLSFFFINGQSSAWDGHWSYSRSGHFWCSNAWFPIFSYSAEWALGLNVRDSEGWERC